MISAIDTNVLIALWSPFDSLNSKALEMLDHAHDQGGLVINGAVYAELLGFRGRTESMLDEFLANSQIRVEWIIDEPIWRSAAWAYHAYVNRRRKQKQVQPKRILTDFLIGAHAMERKYSLLTLDHRIFKAAFPHLKIIRV